MDINDKVVKFFLFFPSPSILFLSRLFDFLRMIKVPPGGHDLPEVWLVFYISSDSEIRVAAVIYWELEAEEAASGS